MVLRYKDENLQPWLTATRLGRIMMVVYAFAFVCLVWLVDKIVVRKPMQQNNKTSTSLSGFS